MVELGIEDLIISIEASKLQITESQRDLLRKHQELFESKLGNVNPESSQAGKFFYEALEEVEGAYDVYILLHQLTDRNMMRLANGSKQ